MFEFFKRNEPNEVKSTVSSFRTTSRVVTLLHNWTIDNFDLCHTGVSVANSSSFKGTRVANYAKLGHSTIDGIKYPYLRSAKFSQPDEPKIDFRLLLYPCGEGEKDDKECISLYLCSNCTESHRLWFKLSLKDSTSHVIYSRHFDCNFGSRKTNENRGPSWGVPKFFPRKFLDRSGWGKNFLPDNKLIVQCKIRYVTDVDTIEA